MRLVGMGLAFILCAGLLSYKLVNIQLIHADRYATKAESQTMRTISLAAERGTIFDRNGYELALSVPSQSIFANPKKIESPYVVANSLAPILQLDPGELERKLNGNGSFVFIKRQVDDETVKRIKSLNLAGIQFLKEPKRIQPAGDLMTSVLGKVGVDNEGLSGFELQYNRALAGKPGKMLLEGSVDGRAIPGGRRSIVGSQQGTDFVLTIDRNLQHVAADALSKEIVKSGARGGMALMMDTKTGDILAMVNMRRDLSDLHSVPVSSANNMALTNVYEPGSVNKMITVSAAMEEGLVSPSTTLTVPNTIPVADHVFSEHDPHPTQPWTVTDIIANSSNVGSIMIAEQLGKTRLDRYLRKFGLGAKTGLNYPGESRGILLDPKNWYPTSIGTVPIGQGISVTAMQMLAAYNTISNGGVYVPPRLVKSTIDTEGKTHDTKMPGTHRVVSTRTASMMTGMLNEVVRVGTGKLAQISGYTVAGKTGTARKPNVGIAGYQENKYVSSFAGFVPSEQPRFTGMVILDEPYPIFGGVVAAPVFAEISKYALREYRVPPPAPIHYPGIPFANDTAVDTSEAKATSSVDRQTSQVKTSNTIAPKSG